MKEITFMISAMILVAINSICQDTWTQLNLPNTEMQVLSLTTDNNNRLFIGSDDNIHYTENNGDTWSSGTNWPEYPVKCMAVNSQNMLFVGSFNDGIYLLLMDEKHILQLMKVLRPCISGAFMSKKMMIWLSVHREVFLSRQIMEIRGVGLAIMLWMYKP